MVVTSARMCGRVALCDRDRARAASGVARECGKRRDDALPPVGSRANASPGCEVTCARVDRKRGREDELEPGAASCALQEVTWGITRERREGGVVTEYDRQFNARAEALCGREGEAGALSEAARAARRSGGRGVMYVEGFFEWREEGPKGLAVKQPYFVRRADGGALALGAVVSQVGDRKKIDEGEVASYLNDLEAAIVTISSRGGDLAWLHDRMPLIIANERDFNRWLFDDWETMAERRKAADYNGLLRWDPVSTKVNLAAYNGDNATKPVKREVEKNTGSVTALFAAATAKKIKVQTEVDGDSAAEVSVISLD